MYPKEGVSLRLNFGNHGESKVNKNQTKMNRAVIKDRLGCGIVPCLNHGKCTLYPFSSLGFLCICPPGFYGDFCQHHAVEPITIISLIGIIAIPILILALCFAICCICNRERLHHQALKKNSEICLNPSPVTCAPKPPCTPCPRTDRYQERYERKDCIPPVEPENLDHLLCGRRNDPCPYNPELIGTRSSVADCQQNNVAELERCTENYGPCPAMEAEEDQRKCSSHSMSQGPCPAVKQSSVKCQTDPETVDRKTSSSHLRSKSPCPAALVNNQRIKAAEEDRRKSSPQSQASCPENECTEVAKKRKKPSSTRSQSPYPAHDRCSVVKDEPTEAAEGERKVPTLSTISQDPCPVADRSPTVKNEQTKAAEGEKKSTSSTRSRRSCPAANRGTVVKNEQTKAAENRKTSTRNQGPCPENLQTEQPVEVRRTSLSSMRCVPLPENQLIWEAHEGRRKFSTIDSYLDPCSAYEFNCLEGSMPGAYEDSEHRTRTTESSDQMFVEKCDAECQFSYPASIEPSEICKNNNDLCLDEVEQASSNFQCKNQEIIPCNNLSDSTTSSQSSYQEYLSTLPTDISTPRSESSSQSSSSSEIADDFGHKSECSLNSSIPSEALLNLMQSYFANGDDVKSVKISILLDKSQSDDLSHSTNVKESTSRISDQMNSPSTSEGYSKMGLKNNFNFLDRKNTLTDVESSLSSLGRPARNCTSLDSPEFGSLIPAMEVDSSDWYCTEDKEPCNKATTVRYMFTDSETDA